MDLGSYLEHLPDFLLRQVHVEFVEQLVNLPDAQGAVSVFVSLRESLLQPCEMTVKGETSSIRWTFTVVCLVSITTEDPTQRWPQPITCLHLTLSSATSSLTPTNSCPFTSSTNLLFLRSSSNLSILLLISSLGPLSTSKQSQPSIYDFISTSTLSH